MLEIMCIWMCVPILPHTVAYSYSLLTIIPPEVPKLVICKTYLSLALAKGQKYEALCED